MTFQPSSKGLDHALVVCDLTQIPTEGSGCRWGGGGAAGIPDLDSRSGILLLDVKGHLYFASMPILLST